VGAQDFVRLLRADGLNASRRAQPHCPLAAFDEHPILFSPTAFTEKGAGYLSRVLHFTPSGKVFGPNCANNTSSPALSSSASTAVSVGASIRCLAYEAAEHLIVSQYLPVAAMFRVLIRRPSVACMEADHEPTFRVIFDQVTVALSTEDNIVDPKTPLLRLYSLIGGTRPTLKAPARSAEGLVFTDTGKCALELSTHVMSVINSESVQLVLLDDAASTGSRHVATGVLPLENRVGGRVPPGRPTNFSLAMYRAGGVVGRCTGRIHWEPSTMNLMDGVMA
jgi:hypothetical protein